MRPVLSRLPLILALSGGLAHADPPRVVLPDIPVPAQVPRPEITIFVSRQDVRPDLDEALDESFLPKIVESADKLPGASPAPAPVTAR